MLFTSVPTASMLRTHLTDHLLTRRWVVSQSRAPKHLALRQVPPDRTCPKDRQGQAGRKVPVVRVSLPAVVSA